MRFRTTVETLVPDYFLRREQSLLIAELVVDGQQFIVHLKIPTFLVPESPHWPDGIRHAQIKAARELARQINSARLC